MTGQFSHLQRNPMYSLIQYHGQNAVSTWKERIEWFMNSSQCRELDRTDGEPTKFEWKLFPGFTTVQILAEIQNMMILCKPEQFPGRIIFMSLHNDIVLWEKRKQRIVYREIQNLCRRCKKIRARTWVVSRAWIGKEMGRNSYVQTEW